MIVDAGTRALVLFALLEVFLVDTASSQFSPGELSRAHQQLEGLNNCSQCHEVGKEISGRKCLVCHPKIQQGLDAKQGYHFAVSSKNCVGCHKEHLGRDVQTVLFDKNTFDHRETGFSRTGKHASIQCEDCHAVKNIRDAEVLRTLAGRKRITYLGLNKACIACHEDRHRGAVGKECQSCHTTIAWAPASMFDHAKTQFPLTGKHAGVQCGKCHSEAVDTTQAKILIKRTKRFSDCSPCHSTPHNEKFADRTCKSCHSTDAWQAAQTQKFDHNLTSFKLIGAHARVKCQHCHKTAGTVTFRKSFKLPHAQCIDCHLDYHRGEFASKYGGDCSRCHLQDAFVPSTFSITAHSGSRFPLTGAHMATPCARCHVRTGNGPRLLHVASLRCESCHQDMHAGQFKKQMAEKSCGACHSTEEWKLRTFDHSKTGFALTGRHTALQCANCHKPKHTSTGELVVYHGLPSSCESCHKEVHGGQFAANGGTDCSKCHSPQSWKAVIFDHNTQSSFVLTGVHKKLECSACHRPERAGDRLFVRFKPLSSKCESCHQQGGPRRG